MKIRKYSYDLRFFRDGHDGSYPFVATATLADDDQDPHYEVTITFPKESPGALDSYFAGLVFKIGRGWETRGGRYKSLREAANAQAYALARRHGWLDARGV